MRFDGRIVVLTGVGREGQVGEAVARHFGTLNATLATVDRNLAQAETRAAALRAEGFDAHPFAANLSDAPQVDALAAAIGTAFGGRVDALVHMAGGFGASGQVAVSDPAVWHHQIDINLTTAYLTTRALLPLLRSREGAIVYFASAAVLPGGSTAEISAYAAAKSGVVALMHAVAAEEREHGVRANALAPSAIRTAANVGAMGEGVRYVEREDVAAAVAFLCSDRAAAISGQLIGLGG